MRRRRKAARKRAAGRPAARRTRARRARRPGTDAAQPSRREQGLRSAAEKGSQTRAIEAAEPPQGGEAARRATRGGACRRERAVATRRHAGGDRRDGAGSGLSAQKAEPRNGHARGDGIASATRPRRPVRRRAEERRKTAARARSFCGSSAFRAKVVHAAGAEALSQAEFAENAEFVCRTWRESGNAPASAPPYG